MSQEPCGISKLSELRSFVKEASPEFGAVVLRDLAPSLIPEYASPGLRDDAEKHINDPIWKIISLNRTEIAVVNTPLCQRLRRVRQLGLATLVYPGANHSRLEHCLGAMHAAGEMATHLLANSRLALVEDAKPQYVRIARLAALLHDCGHPAFSHSGERVLEELFGQSSEVVWSSFRQLLLDPIAPNVESELRDLSKKPSVSEIISALLVTSEPMEVLLTTLGPPFKGVEESLQLIAALILGIPTKALRVGVDFYQFPSQIVSGYLDADKLDYVARDAYFAGIPISADVPRLISQIVAWRVNKNTQLHVVDGVKNYDLDTDTWILALKRSGIFALEMFVLTRAYLIDRLYKHQKVRAAEAYLERLLAQYIQSKRRERAWSAAEILQFLFRPTGDDGVLEAIHEDASIRDQRIRSTAVNLLNRRLPVRALAVRSKRHVLDQSALMITASKALHDLSRSRKRRNQFEREICRLADVEPGGMVILDFSYKKPFDENPDVWMVEPDEESRIFRANTELNVDQLSNAYEQSRRVNWVFAYAESHERVAASAAAVMAKDLGVHFKPESLHISKVNQNEYEKHLLQIQEKDSSYKSAVEWLLDSSPRKFFAAPVQFHGLLAGRSEADRQDTATRLAEEMNNIQIPFQYAREMDFLLLVAEALFTHSTAYYSNAEFRTDAAPDNESRFEKHVLAHLNSHYREYLRAEKHPDASGGKTDIVVQYVGVQNEVYSPVVVELKSEPKGYEQLLSTHAGQPLVYSQENYSRLSVLYCQFKGPPERPEDTLRFRSSAGKRLAVFCIGQAAFADRPSERGGESVGPDQAPSSSAPAR